MIQAKTAHQLVSRWLQLSPWTLGAHNMGAYWSPEIHCMLLIFCVPIHFFSFRGHFLHMMASFRCSKIFNKISFSYLVCSQIYENLLKLVKCTCDTQVSRKAQ
jgi:hypothetical protein